MKMSILQKKWIRVLLYFSLGISLILLILCHIFVKSPATLINKPSVELQYGIADGSLSYLGQDELMMRLMEIKNLGITWVRFDMDWSVIQREGRDDYDWSGHDRLITDLNTLGLKGLGIIDYTPKWARGENCLQSNKCAPADPAQFATFAREAVKRYSPQGIHNWEIWNEPNLVEFWQPKPNVEYYSKFLRESYIAIKKRDNSAHVIAGGLSGADTGNGNISPIDFLTQLYSNGAGEFFDAIALHPYSYPSPPSYYSLRNPWFQIASTTPSLRSIMVENGDGDKKIWLTEYGAPTAGPGNIATPDNYDIIENLDHVTETFQARMIIEASKSAQKMPWVGPLFFYTYKDAGTSFSTNENFFGLVRYDGSVKPSYTALKNIIEKQ